MLFSSSSRRVQSEGADINDASVHAQTILFQELQIGSVNFVLTYS
jgi:hypothetical protein